MVKILCLGLFIVVQTIPINRAEAQRSIATTAKPENKMISQRMWLAQFEMFFSQEFCQNARFTELCLQMSSKACQIQTSNYVLFCTEKIGLPHSIPLGESSVLFGQKMGRCIARGMESKLSQKKADPKCTDLSLWE